MLNRHHSHIKISILCFWQNNQIGEGEKAYEGDTFSHSKDTSLHSAELRQEGTNPKLEWQATSQSESS